jgi:hypothetical protein
MCGRFFTPNSEEKESGIGRPLLVPQMERPYKMRDSEEQDKNELLAEIMLMKTARSRIRES